jgi:hypothetical protein
VSCIAHNRKPDKSLNDSLPLAANRPKTVRNIHIPYRGTCKFWHSMVPKCNKGWDRQVRNDSPQVNVMSDIESRPAQYGVRVREIDRQRINFLAALNKKSPTAMAAELLSKAARLEVLKETSADSGLVVQE